MAFAHHVLLLCAVAAVAFAAWRAASALGQTGLLAIVVAAVFAGGFAEVTALGLGLAGLGGNAVVLALASFAAAGAAWRWLAPPAPDPAEPVGSWGALTLEPDAPLGSVTPAPTGAVAQLRVWWAGLTDVQRGGFGAALGVLVVWCLWLMKHPAIGIDPMSYHLPEAVRWLQNGHPGRVETVEYEWPAGNYPLTDEVIVGWISAIGRTFAPAMFWVPLCAALFATAGWVGLRRLNVPQPARVLAIGVVLMVPINATQLLGPHNDLPSLAWLICTAALVVHAKDDPKLLGVALVAAGLSVGTKTTAGPLAVIVLLIGAYTVRATFPWRAIGLGALGAIAVGGVWYLRNFIEHGSPLWPFVHTPGGDPVPRFLKVFDTSFLDRPKATVDGRQTFYVDVLGGGILMVLLGPLLWLSARTKAVAAAIAIALFADLTWAQAPFTGLATNPIVDLSLTTTRYLFPAICAIVLAAALAVRDGRSSGAKAVPYVLLGLALLINVARCAKLVFPATPSIPFLVVGAALVGGAFYLAPRVLPRLAFVVRQPIATAVVLVLVVAGGLTVSADGLGRRHGAIGRLSSAGVVTFLEANPTFKNGSQPVSFAPQMVAILAGDRMKHHIEMLPVDVPCASVRAKAQKGYVVVGTPLFGNLRAHFTAAGCMKGQRSIYRDKNFTVYSSL